MEILGLVFVGSATPHRTPMASFVAEVLGLRPAGSTPDADMFVLPDGARFAVTDEREEGQGTSRTIGFLVHDVTAAAAELRSARIEVDDVQEFDRQRYVHFVAPDGSLYELVEERAGS